MSLMVVKSEKFVQYPRRGGSLFLVGAYYKRLHTDNTCDRVMERELEDEVEGLLVLHLTVHALSVEKLGTVCTMTPGLDVVSM